jgi:tetratricopeptide (TPR) repeat protein
LAAKIQSGYIGLWWKGDTGALRHALVDVPAGTDPDGVVTSCRWDGAMMERDFKGAADVLAASSLDAVDYTNGGATPKTFLAGCTAMAVGNQSAAQASFATAAAQFEKALKEQPEVPERHANLGLCYAFMGRRDDAIREGRRAVELKPESKDAFDGAIMNCYLALIYARLGEKELAFPLIERLLKTPGAVDSVDYSITVNDLKFRWEWDTIRSDPRFAALIADVPAK